MVEGERGFRMSATINDGGPAFPNVPSDPQYQSWDEGMSLRDYFAGQALAGMLAVENSDAHNDATLARYAYCLADAMLEARNQKGGQA